MIGCLQAKKGQFLAAFWCKGRQCIKMTGTSRRPNVVTLSQHIKKSTSGNVATLLRRDVSASYSSQSLKGKWEQNSRGIGDWGSYELGHRIQSSSDIDLYEEPVICIFLRFLGQ